MAAKPPIHTGPLRVKTTALTLQPGASFRENEFGTDVWDIPYVVPTQFALELLPPRYSVPIIAGKTYGNMALVSRNFSHEEGLMSKYNLTFKGVGLALPDAKSSDGSSLQSGGGAINLNPVLPLNVTARWQYYTKTTTWRWCAIKRPNPDKPLHSGVNSKLSPWDGNNMITFYVADAATGLPITNSSDITSIRNAFKSASPGKDALTDYKINEVIPGRFWECESTTTRIIGV